VAVGERLHRLFDYLRAVRAVFDRPARDITAGGELYWQGRLAAAQGAHVGRSSPDPAADDAWLLVGRQALPPPLAAPERIDPALVIGPLDDPSAPPELDGAALAVEAGAGEAGAGASADRFAAWVAGAWRPWAAATLAHRLYRDLWDLALRLGQDEATLELVWGHALLGWEVAGERLLHPLLVTPARLRIDPERGQVRAHPTGTAALELAFLDGLGLPGLEALRELREHLREDPVDPWDPARTRELCASVGDVLRADLRVVAGGDPPPVGPEPVVAATSVLYVRRRTVSYRRFLERAAVAIDAGRLADGPLATVVAHGGPGDRQPPPEPDGPGGRLLTPLPTNAEQEEIGRRLASHRGITVQGPPGTGKTHTIANLLSHLMAQGRRVLVASHKEQPLEVLRSFLPERIRPLCVSLLGVDAGGLGQLDQSVQAILRETSTLDRERARAVIDGLRARLEEADAELGEVRAELAACLDRERSRYELDGRPRSPAEIGRRLAAAGAGFGFVPDTLDPGDRLPLDTAELGELYRLAGQIAEPDRLAVAAPRPDPAALPRGQALRALLATIAEADATLAELDQERPSGRIAASMSPAGVEAIARRVEAVAEVYARVDQPWLVHVRSDLRRSEAARASWRDFGAFVGRSVAELYELEGRVGPHEFVLPDGVTPRQLTHRLTTLSRQLDGSARPLGPSALINRWNLASLGRTARVDGGPARTAEDVELLVAAVTLAKRRGELVTAWNRQVGKVGGPTVEPDDPAAAAAIERAWATLEEALAFESGVWPEFRERLRWSGLLLAPVPSAEELLALLEDVGLARSRVGRERDRRRAVEARAAAEGELGGVRRAVEAGRRLERASPLWAELDAALQLEDVPAWEQALKEAQRLAALEPRVHRLDELAARLRQRAPLWTERIITGHDQAGDPARAARAWALRKAETWLDRLVAAGDPAAITERLEELGEVRGRLVSDLVAWSTWLAVAERITDDQRRALNGWVQAVRRIGKGTGRHANRYRGIAREQMERCRDAVPVWVMPVWRVVETFEPDTAGPPFDVVIVDESSQCDLFSLGVLALGRQVVVVGDDKQISPTLICDHGVVHELIERHIADLPDARLLDTTASLYDVAKWAFPGVVMLREHFRCLPEIIAFSNELMYDGEVLPLRERLEDTAWQPVRATRVQGAYRLGAINEAEAEALAATVVDCCQDPAYDGRTMGVVSLMGEAQARHVQHLLLERLGEREYSARRLKCGDAYRFQGDERDVLFLSMVAASGDRQAAMTRLADRQRINVAASRARDQLWLFHSVDPAELHPDDARGLLLRFCLDPPGRGLGAPGGAADPGSSLERAVLRALRGRGFRVRTQVQVGHWRIDLVVEGARGRRLAVECHGEAAGVDRHDADERRQLVLERLGWRFHQVRASAFYRDPDATLASLYERLAELDVHPSVIPPPEAGAAAGPRVTDGARDAV
jgi:very-short-patch-repair endonuclease